MSIKNGAIVSFPIPSDYRWFGHKYALVIEERDEEGDIRVANCDKAAVRVGYVKEDHVQDTSRTAYQMLVDGEGDEVELIDGGDLCHGERTDFIQKIYIRDDLEVHYRVNDVIYSHHQLRLAGSAPAPAPANPDQLPPQCNTDDTPDPAHVWAVVNAVCRGYH